MSDVIHHPRTKAPKGFPQHHRFRVQRLPSHGLELKRNEGRSQPIFFWWGPWENTVSDRVSGIKLEAICHELKVCVPPGRIHSVVEFLERLSVRIGGQVCGDRVHRRYKGAELTEPH